MRCTVYRCTDQGLNLQQQRASAFHHHANGRPAQLFGSLGKQETRRIQYGHQSRGVHLVQANFCRGTESVFVGAQESVQVVLVAFKLQNNVHHVLQNFGTRQGSFFGDVPNEQNRHVVALGVAQKLCGTLPNLGNAAGRGFQCRTVQGLNGVNHQDLRTHFFCVFQNGRG